MMKEKLAKTAELKARLGTTNTAQHPDKPVSPYIHNISVHLVELGAVCDVAP